MDAVSTPARWSAVTKLIFIFFMLCATQGYAATYRYTINLESSSQPLNPINKLDESFKKYQVYTVKLEINSKYKYKRRLGFFKTRIEAKKVLKNLKPFYPNAWIDTIYNEEKRFIYGKNTPVKKSSSRASANNAALMALGRQAMLDKKYRKAIGIYTKVARSKEQPYAKEALEFLGLARERNGQLAHAKAEYQKYLKLYAGTEGYERVKQRLVALTTLSDKQPAKLEKNKKIQKASFWQHYGTFIQSFDETTIDTEQFGKITAAKLLSSHINYNARLVNSDYRIRSNLSALHIYDLEDSITDDERLNSLYIDILSPDRDFDTRVGRQKGRAMGVIGRFDGLDFSYQIAPGYSFRVINGYPYEKYTTVAHRDQKSFSSIGLEIGPVFDDWDFEIFSLEQVADDITDRKEVGGSVRYRSDSTSFFSSFDYSTQFSTYNFFTMVLNLKFENNSTLDFIADLRKSPFLTTTSALQGQTGVSTLSDLLQTLTEEEINQLSLDRTSIYRSFSTIYGNPLADDLKFTADISLTNLSDTTTSGGVEAIQGTGTETSSSIGLIANSLLMKHDINIINFRISNLSISTAAILTLSSKYRFNKHWRFSPRIKLDKRDYDDGRQVDKLTPSFRLKYKRNKNWEFDLDLAYEKKETDVPGNDTQIENSLILHTGYVYIF